MKKVLKIALTTLSILTAIFVSAVVFNASANIGEGKYQEDYGLHTIYALVRLQAEPQEWNTTEELGIIFGRKLEGLFENEAYQILIVDAEKALPWLNGTEPLPYAVKNESSFYQIKPYLKMDYGPSSGNSFQALQIPIGGVLGAGWLCTGVLFLKQRKKE